MFDHRVCVAPDDLQKRGLGYFELFKAYNWMCVVSAVLYVVPLVETNPAATVSLTSQDINISVPVPVYGVSARNHHNRVRFHDRGALQIGEIRFFAWLTMLAFPAGATDARVHIALGLLLLLAGAYLRRANWLRRSA